MLRTALALLCLCTLAPCLLVWLHPALLTGPWLGCRRIAFALPPAVVNDSSGSQQRKPLCVVVLGSSSGVGRALASRLLGEMGASVVLSGRTADRARKAMEGTARGKVLAALGVDLADRASVDAFVGDVARAVYSCEVVDAMFLNAGMFSTTPNTSLDAEDGMDVVFKSNFVGSARVLKGLLHHGVVRPGKTRVVVTSSIAHLGGDAHQIPQPLSTPALTIEDQWQRYWTSKLALTALQQELRESRGLDVISVTCGFVKTGISFSPEQRGEVTHSGWPRGMEFMQALEGLLFTPEQGAEFVLGAAFTDLALVRADEFLYPYWMPASNRAEPTGQPGPSRFYPAWMAFEWLQKLTARPGFLFSCASAPEARQRSTREAVMRYW